MKTSALYSKYIIDGIQRELTPADMLDSVLEPHDAELEAAGHFDPIADESLDPGATPLLLDPERIDEYLTLTMGDANELPFAFAGPYTRGRIAAALIDSIWRQGRFRLEDLVLTAKWSWSADRIGGMAALYSSVEAAADYIDGLGISLRRYSVVEGPASVRFATPFSGAALKCPDVLQDDPSGWIVYIPFDTSDYRLGGSLLAHALGLSGGIAPKIEDPDYFMDCYEVIREMVEDGVIIAGTTVGDGGLLTAVKRMTAGGVGAELDLSDVMRAFQEKDRVRILFGEVPGVVVQIRDMDFDYLDAELLLQDVLFFPLGHPVRGTDSVRVKASAKTGLQTILESLLTGSQLGEGED